MFFVSRTGPFGYFGVTAYMTGRKATVTFKKYFNAHGKNCHGYQKYRKSECHYDGFHALLSVRKTATVWVNAFLWCKYIKVMSIFCRLSNLFCNLVVELGAYLTNFLTMKDSLSPLSRFFKEKFIRILNSKKHLRYGNEKPRAENSF